MERVIAPVPAIAAAFAAYFSGSAVATMRFIIGKIDLGRAGNLADLRIRSEQDGLDEAMINRLCRAQQRVRCTRVHRRRFRIGFSPLQRSTNSLRSCSGSSLRILRLARWPRKRLRR